MHTAFRDYEKAFDLVENGATVEGFRARTVEKAYTPNTPKTNHDLEMLKLAGTFAAVDLINR